MDIRTIVVDNTVELKDKLTKLLNEIPGVTVCQSFDDAVAAMQYVEEHPVDLVFSDVVMPGDQRYHPGVLHLRPSGTPGGGASVRHSRIFSGSLEGAGVRLHHKALHPPSDRRHDQKNSGSAPDFGRPRNFSLSSSYCTEITL